MDLQATFFATLVDEWVRCGVTDAVLGAGQRSTILAGTLEKHPSIRTHVMVDERSAAYFALGIGIATQRPAVLWVTSGTATLELSAAVAEANTALVPLLVCTADRPLELQHARDWQSMDQRYLYQGATRWSFNPGVADAGMSSSWRSIAARSVGETMHHPAGPGPVHLNLPIREPWTFEYGDLPVGRPNNAPWHQWHSDPVAPSSELVSVLAQSGKRGVIIAGKTDLDAETVHACAQALGWPVLAEIRSEVRLPLETTVSTADALTRIPEFAEQQKPEIVLRLGMPVISKSVASWIQASGAEEWLIDMHDVWAGPTPDAHRIIRCDPNAFCKEVTGSSPVSTDPQWLESWKEAEAIAQQAIDESLAGDELSEPSIARCLVEYAPEHSNLFASTSMPVRDIEWYGKPRTNIHVHANRGLSGLEGLISTAAGIASSFPERSNLMMVGDLGFLYDINSLWALDDTSNCRLTIVVVDNNGGGIFSLFSQLRGLGNDVFERVVATPHDMDLISVAQGFGVTVEEVKTRDELKNAVEESARSNGIHVVYVRTERPASLELRNRIHELVAQKIRNA